MQGGNTLQPKYGYYVGDLSAFQLKSFHQNTGYNFKICKRNRYFSYCGDKLSSDITIKEPSKIAAQHFYLFNFYFKKIRHDVSSESSACLAEDSHEISCLIFSNKNI